MWPSFERVQAVAWIFDLNMLNKAEQGFSNLKRILKIKSKTEINNNKIKSPTETCVNSYNREPLKQLHIEEKGKNLLFHRIE